MVRLLNEERQTRSNAGAGRHDDAGLEEAGNAEHTVLRSTASVDLGRGVVDDLIRPIAGVGYQNGEAFLAGVGEARRGRCLLWLHVWVLCLAFLRAHAKLLLGHDEGVV